MSQKPFIQKVIQNHSMNYTCSPLIQWFKDDWNLWPTVLQNLYHSLLLQAVLITEMFLFQSLKLSNIYLITADLISVLIIIRFIVDCFTFSDLYGDFAVHSY